MIAGRTPLRGRRREQDLLRAHVGSVGRDGRGRVVVLQGAAGSGKSRLLDEARSIAQEAGSRVLSFGGDPDAHVIPHGPLLDCVRSGPSPLLPPSVLAQLPAGPEQGYWLRNELEARLQEVAVDCPILVCVDDLQWCDPATLRVLRTLPPRLAGDAVFWLVAVRRGVDAPAVVATVEALADAGADVVDVPRLDDAAVAEIAADVLGGTPDSRLLTSAARAGGQPLLLVELLRGLQDEALIQVDDGTVRLVSDELPARLRDTIGRRTARLSGPARDLLQVGAVLGRRFSVAVLADVLDRHPVALLDPLHEVIHAGLLSEDGEQMAFRHDLIREAVAAGMPTGLARMLGRHAVDVLMARGAPTVQVATLLAESALAGDLDAVASLREAAASLAVTASPAAADLSLRAMQLLPADSPVRPAVVAEAVQHLWLCGRSAAAQQLAATALESALEKTPAAGAPVRLGMAYIISPYSTAAADDQCRAGLALDGVPRELRLQLLLLQGVNLGLGGDPEGAARVLASVHEAREGVADPAVDLAVTRMETYIAFHRRQWARAFQLHEQVVRARPPDAQLKPPGLWEAAMWMSVGHPDRALSIVDAEIVAARRDGRVGTMLMWTNMRTRALYDAGRLDEARAQADEVLELEETPVVGGMTGLLVFYSLVRGALHAGRRDVIRAHRQRIDLMIADQSGQIRRNGLWLRALVAESDSDVQEALRFADEAVTMLDQPGPAMSGLPDLVDEVILTRMAIRGGARETAVRAVAAAERRAADNPTFPMATAAARHARGLLDADADSLRVAVELLEAGTRPLLLASAQEDLARQVHSARPREAVALLDEALRAYTAAGAEHDAARTRRRLRDLGVRRRRATPPGKALAGLSALTAAEREVVRLVTEGGTNRQVAERLFLSPHTVNTHLRNAFIKLDVRSRVELTRLVADEHGA